MRPGAGGIVTDLPSYLLEPEQSAHAENAVIVEAQLRQRAGWAYDGSVADVAAPLVSVAENRFVLADALRVVTASNLSEVYLHNPAGAGTVIYDADAIDAGEYLPRCIYRDELILCHQSGEVPLLRYSGSPLAHDAITDGLGAFTAGVSQMTRTAGAFPVAGPGGYAMFIRQPSGTAGVQLSHRILEQLAVGSNAVTLEDIRSLTAGNTFTAVWIMPVGYGYPAVAVYDAGTITSTSGAATATGAKWVSGEWGKVRSPSSEVFSRDAMLLYPVAAGGNVEHTEVSAVNNETSVNVSQAGRGSAVNYAITRKLPFADATVHRDSFFGTRVKQHPSRVYAFPQGWNMSLPPGFVPPLNVSVALASTRATDFLGFEIDVPGPSDGDSIEAIVSAPEVLLVLKRRSVHGIYGDYPNFSQGLIDRGPGCIDMRSAVSLSVGQFWASDDGIYRFANGAITDITAGRINREWRALTADYDYSSDRCAIGEHFGHLLISIRTGAGATRRSYLYDLAGQTFTSRLTNLVGRFAYHARVAAQAERLLVVDDDEPGRVIDASPAINGTGIAKDGDGASPLLVYRSGSALARAAGIEGEAVALDVALHARVTDAGAAGATALGLTWNHGGGLGQGTGEIAKALAGVSSDPAERVDRHDRRVDRTGRLHQLQVASTQVGTNTAATRVELAETVCEFVDLQAGT